MNLERLALFATLGVLLDALGQDWSTWGFWCTLALTLTIDILARKDGMEQGIWLTANLSIEQLQEIQQQIKDLEDDQ
jgi:hypothetical protein